MITKIENNCNSSTKHSYNTVQRTQIATAIRHFFWLTKQTHRFWRGFLSQAITWITWSVTIKDIPSNTSNCFRREKSPDFTIKLAIISSINLTSGIIFAFIFLQKSQKRLDHLEYHVWNFQHFLKSTKQIKIIMVERKNCFEPEWQKQLMPALQYS